MKVKDIKNGHKCRCINKDGVCFDVVIQRVEPINDDIFRLFVVNPNSLECFNVDVNGENRYFIYHRVDSSFSGENVTHYTIFLDEDNLQYLK